MSTDAAWEEWGRRDPYFGVITDPRFRRMEMNEQAKRDFFESGRLHVDHLLQVLNRYIDPQFTPKTIVEFGCGVGRLLIPFSAVAQEVVGLDVSPSMLQEARSNCDDHQLTNVRLLGADDSLSSLKGTFDLIHSAITFQHIPSERGREIFRKLLDHLGPGGIAAIHFSYSKSHYVETHGIAPASLQSDKPPPSPVSPLEDPAMQMNPYNVNELLFLMQCRGVRKFHAEFTDHGGELGIFIYFQVA